MTIGTIEDMRRDMENGVYNFTKDGKCIGCGNCCSNLLPVSETEMRRIFSYIKKNHIKEQKHFAPVAKQMVDLTCPFLDANKKSDKCTIYPVRPAICRCFICSEPKGAIKHKELYEEERPLIDVRRAFYGHD